jgi:radical SAM superfamily enzyme YgiQ (UPF0313 family)
MKTRHLLLVNPRFRFKHYAAQAELARLVGKRLMQIPLQLPLLAALTPPGWRVRIADDETERLPERPRPDLVGITTLHATSARAYEIAARYRALGSKVVLGGSYATFRVEEALQHADCVVAGEAEEVWPRLLADLEAGRLQRVYRAETPPAFRTSPPPRWDLVKPGQMLSVGVETSRGCPYGCPFCMVHTMFGRKVRYREPEDVVRELRAAPHRRLFFLADNFALKTGYARELVERLKPLGFTWVCQASIDIVDHPELLDAMAEAGCLSILIGFESLNPSVTAILQKNVDHFKRFGDAVRAVHARGILVLASFVVGFDADRLDAFDRILEFTEQHDVVFPMINILSAAAGTLIHERMAQAGRLCDLPADYRNGMFPCVHYLRMGQRELLDKYFDTLRALYAPAAVRTRAVRLFSSGAFQREAKDVVPLGEKITTSATVLRRYLLTRDPAKRGLFLELMKLARTKRLAMDKLVLFLLSMEGIQDFLREANGYLPEVRAALARTDQGPWIDRHPDAEPILVGEECAHQRQPGLDAGLVEIADDFDAPLPEELHK